MTQSELLREIYATEAKIASGAKGQTALKAYHRKLFAQYMRTLAKTGEAA